MFQFKVLVDDLAVAGGQCDNKEQIAIMAFNYAMQYVEEVDKKIVVIIKELENENK